MQGYRTRYEAETDQRLPRNRKLGDHGDTGLASADQVRYSQRAALLDFPNEHVRACLHWHEFGSLFDILSRLQGAQHYDIGDETAGFGADRDQL